MTGAIDNIYNYAEFMQDYDIADGTYNVFNTTLSSAGTYSLFTTTSDIVLIIEANSRGRYGALYVNDAFLIWYNVNIVEHHRFYIPKGNTFKCSVADGGSGSVTMYGVAAPVKLHS